MNKEDKMRKTINQLAQKYREQVNPNMSHEQAKRRIIKSFTKSKKGE